MECLYLMKWQYVKDATCINWRPAQNSGGPATGRSGGNNFCDYYVNSNGLNGLNAIFVSYYFIINDKFYYTDGIIATLIHLRFQMK